MFLHSTGQRYVNWWTVITDFDQQNVDKLKIVINLVSNTHECVCPGGTIGRVTVLVTWLQWPTWPGFKAQAGRIICVRFSSVCFEIKFSGKHKLFDCVLFKLWPLAITGFRGAQSIVPAWASDNRWHTTACTGSRLMAVFERTAKLGSGAYGARHTRSRPCVMQWVLAVR